MRALKLIDELQRRALPSDISEALRGIQSAVEAETAKEQNINARLQAQVRDLNWRLRQGEEGRP